MTEKPIGVIINRLSRRKRNPYYTAAVIPDVNADKEVTPHTHASNGHNGNGQKPEQVAAAPMAPIAPVGNSSSLSGYAVPPSPNRGTTSLMDFSTMQSNPNSSSPFPSPREKR